MSASAWWPRLPPLLAAVVVVDVLVLATLRLAGAPLGIELAAQAVLIVAFAALAIVDFRAAMAIAIVELVVAGASGQWTQLPGGLSGRLVLNGIVFLVAAVRLGMRWRLGLSALGRYGLHALALAAVMPAVWMTLGLLNGNGPSNVFADGNGQIFFLFALAIVVLLADGHGPWLRRWFLSACLINGAFTGLLAVTGLTGLVPLDPTQHTVLLGVFTFGGAVGYMPNGAFRLYLGSGLYLQVGLALVLWGLLERPRAWWLWAAMALLWFDLIATYTRGYWVGAVVAMVIVLVLGGRDLASRARIATGTVVLAVIAVGATGVIGFSLPAYVLDRAASTTAVGTPVPTVPGSPEPEPEGDGGAYSNSIRAVQAEVLLGHIVERPILGHGFGAIAADYPYGDIFSYELAYLDLMFKTGLVGAGLFLSFPARLLVDATRGRFGAGASAVDRRELSVVIAVLVAVLLTGATNPYLLASFGLFSILAMTAWLDPLGASPEPAAEVPRGNAAHSANLLPVDEGAG